MSTGLLTLIKRAALDVVNNEQMCDLRFGEVTSASPLRVKITSNLTIPSSLLVVPEQLTRREIAVTVENETTMMTIDGSLKIGDKVALLRKQGGQSYFILDRI